MFPQNLTILRDVDIHFKSLHKRITMINDAQLT